MNRLKELRVSKNMTLKQLSIDLNRKYHLTLSDGQLSNYENGKRTPRDPKFWDYVADYYNVSLPYLLGYSDYEQEPEKRLEAEIQSLQKQLEIEEKEVIGSKKLYDKLKIEFDKKSFDTLEDTFLSSLLDDSVSNNLPIEELYENKLEELSSDMLQKVSLRDLTKIALLTKKEELVNLKNELIYNPKDKKNPDFEAHNMDQKKISEYLQGIPYHLNYESTMEVFEHAKELMKKEENRFNP